MVQTINKNHARNTILTNEENGFYIYEGNNRWKKATCNNYYKFYDVDVNSTEIIKKDSPDSPISVNNFNDKDYILTYKSSSNYIKYSESFKSNECTINDIIQWNTIGLNQLSNDENYKFPSTGKVASKFQTNNVDADTYPTEHSISQLFCTTSDELYIVSCFVKPVYTSSNNVALQLFADAYNIGISVKYDLNDNVGYDENDYKSVTTSIEYLNSDFITSSSSVKNHFHGVSAGVYRYKVNENSEYYYRLVIKCYCDFNSNMKLKLLILNNNSEYKYFSKQGQSLYMIYANGFQLEKIKLKTTNDFLYTYHNDETGEDEIRVDENAYNTYIDDMISIPPSNYIITTDKTSTLKVFDKIYTVTTIQSSKEFSRKSANVYYIFNIKEHDEPIDIITGDQDDDNKKYEKSSIITYLDSFKPSIDNPNIDDIAIAPSIISFTDYKPNNSNTKDSMLRLGDTYIANNPEGTVSYDLINSQYKINSDTSFKIFSFVSDEKNKKAIVKALTFNQGNFETWDKQQTKNINKLGYNTGGGFNYNRFYNFYPNKR